MTVTSEETAFTLAARYPFVPFSAFVNDLAVPLFLSNLQPSQEAILAVAQFPAVPAPKEFPSQLFEKSHFDPNKFVLNQPLRPPKPDEAHDFDPFMAKILEDCYSSISHQRDNLTVKVRAPLVNSMTVPLSEKTSTVAASSKIKLNILNGGYSSVDCHEVLMKLIQEDSFVNPLGFDCQETLSLISRLIRNLSVSRPSSETIVALKNLNPTIIQHLNDFFEHLDQTEDPIDPLSMLYGMCLIGMVNVTNAVQSDCTSLQKVFPFHHVLKIVASCPSMAIDRHSLDFVLSLVIESYLAVMMKFRLPEDIVSDLITCQLQIFFSCEFGPVSNCSAAFVISTIFAVYSDYCGYIIDRILIQSVEFESVSEQKSGVLLLLSCIQAFAAKEENPIASLSNFYAAVLNFLWKGAIDSSNSANDLPKGASLFFVCMEVLIQNWTFSHPKWPTASSFFNYCLVQMFHVILREDNNKGVALIMKLRFLDILVTSAEVIVTALQSSKEPQKSKGLLAAMEESSWSAQILIPANTLNHLYPETRNLNGNFLDQAEFRKFLWSGALGKIPERVIGLLIKLISSEAIQLRSKVIKSLFTLMNSGLLNAANYSTLKRNILRKVGDSSISVRDAVLEFISKFIFAPFASSDDLTELISSVLSRLKDRGVSVRKRSVKILGEALQRDLFDSQPRNNQLKGLCLAALISHTPDEEDEVVVELIQKTLKENWVIKAIGPDYQKHSAVAQRSIIFKFGQEVVLVLNALGPASSSAFQNFMREVVEKDGVRAEHPAFFSGIVDFLLENVLKLIEANTDNSNPTSSAEISLKSSLQSIEIFSTSSPKILEPHLTLLQSLIRSDDADIAALAMRLLSTTIPTASLSELKKLADFEKDLFGLIYRGSEFSVKLAIESLYHYVNNCSHQYATLSSLWQRFTDFLLSRRGENTLSVSAADVPHICRALLAMGVLCAQSARHREQEFGMRDYHSSPQALLALELITHFTGNSISFIRSCAFESLSALVIAAPQISLSASSGVIVRRLLKAGLFDEEAECKLKLLTMFDQMTKCFNVEHKFVDPDRHLAGHFINTGDLKKMLAGEGKESYYCALIQENLETISSCIFVGAGSESESTGIPATPSSLNASSLTLEVQAMALKICASSAVLGLVNPQLVIPTIIVGMSSVNPGLQDYSKKSFNRIIGRFPSLLCKDLIAAGRLLHRQSGDGCITVPLTESGDTSFVSVSRMAHFYNSIRGKNGRDGIEAVGGVFNYLESCLTTAAKVDGFCVFLVSLVATLPFKISDEVVHFLQRIQRVFAVTEELVSTNYNEVCDSSSKLGCLLVSLSGAIDYTIKSYPQISSFAFDFSETSEEAPAPIKSLSITSKIPHIFANFICETTKIPQSKEEILGFLNHQTPIPTILQQQNQQRAATTFSKKRKAVYDDEEEDEGFSGDFNVTIVDDEEVVETEIDDENTSSEEFENMLAQFNTQVSTKTQRVSSLIQKHVKNQNVLKTKAKSTPAKDSKGSVVNKAKTHGQGNEARKTSKNSKVLAKVINKPNSEKKKIKANKNEPENSNAIKTKIDKAIKKKSVSESSKTSKSKDRKSDTGHVLKSKK